MPGGAEPLLVKPHFAAFSRMTRATAAGRFRTPVTARRSPHAVVQVVVQGDHATPEPARLVLCVAVEGRERRVDELGH